MELLQLKHDSDILEDASSPADVAAAVTVTASVEHLHPADGDVEILDNAIASTSGWFSDWPPRLARDACNSSVIALVNLISSIFKFQWCDQFKYLIFFAVPMVTARCYMATISKYNVLSKWCILGLDFVRSRNHWPFKCVSSRRVALHKNDNFTKLEDCIATHYQLRRTPWRDSRFVILIFDRSWPRDIFAVSKNLKSSLNFS